MASSDFTTPAKKARGLGAAHAGTQHYISQRVSAVALIVLVPWFLFSVLQAGQAGYDGAYEWAAKPWNSGLLLLSAGAAFHHMRLGMQVVIEDYISGHGLKLALLMANTFAAFAGFVAILLAVLKIWTGA